MHPLTPAGEQLQPDEASLLFELEKVEDAAAARRMERVAEHEIVMLLQLARFDPDTPEWQTLARALAEYGYSVFTGWGISGSLRRMAAGHAGGRGVIGLSKLPEGLRLDRDDALSLAADVTVASVESFRTKTLMNPRRTWKPSGGASLKTYFVGRALMELPDAYERWSREGRRALQQIAMVDDGRHSDDPSRPAIAAAIVAEVRLEDSVVSAMFELQTAGYSLTEIAELFDTTVPAVKSQMTRFRSKVRKQHLDG